MASGGNPAVAASWHLALALVVMTTLSAALDNGLAKTPPMGYRTWNDMHGDVTDERVRRVIDAMVTKHPTIGVSLLGLGFDEVGIDDGWQACGTGVVLKNHTSFHNASGAPLVNASRFPNLSDLVAYGHNAGLRMGWYDNNCICMDEYTIQDDEEFAQSCYRGDAIQVLDAQFDSLKIDNCGDDRGEGYVARERFLNASGKPILLENSNQGFGNPMMNRGKPGPPRNNPANNSDYCPFHMFRTGGDIGPSFGNVIAKLQFVTPYLNKDTPISRPGCWAYPDMLELGNFQGPLKAVEERTHFGAWCIVSSPLVLGTDVTNADIMERVWPIVSNTEALAVNQNWAGHPGFLVAQSSSFAVGDGEKRPFEEVDGWQVWAKPQPNHGAALFVLNAGNTAASVNVSLATAGLDASQTYRVRDLWSRKDLGTARQTFTATDIGSHDSVFVTLTPSP